MALPAQHARVLRFSPTVNEQSPNILDVRHFSGPSDGLRARALARAVRAVV